MNTSFSTKEKFDTRSLFVWDMAPRQWVTGFRVSEPLCCVVNISRQSPRDTTPYHSGMDTLICLFEGLKYGISNLNLLKPNDIYIYIYIYVVPQR